jgi:hypothetical protein
MKKIFWNINEIKTLKDKTIIVTGGKRRILWPTVLYDRATGESEIKFEILQ